MEQKFCREKAGIKAVAHETFCRRLLGLFREMGERAVLKTIRNTLTANDLLADTRHHLRDVDGGT